MRTVLCWFMACLLNSLWQVPLVLLSGLLAGRMVRRSGAGWEHRVWVAVLLLQSFLPVLSAFYWLGIRFSSLRWFQHAGAGGMVSVQLGPGTAVGHRGVLSAVLWRGAVIYGFSVLFFCVRLAVRYRYAMGLRDDARPVCSLDGAHARWASAWGRYQRRFSLRRVQLVSSAKAKVPFTLRIWRPMIVIPEGLLRSLRDDEIATVLAHECAHVQRWDFAKNLVYEVVSVFVAYHPCLWVARSRIAESREWVADAAACNATVGAERYARSLLRLASLLSELTPAQSTHAIGMFGANSLERRLMYLTHTARKPEAARRLFNFCTCAVLALSTCGSAWAWRTRVDDGVPLTEARDTGPGAGGTKVSGKVMAGQVLKQVNPSYPQEAREAKIQGAVVLAAVIGRDGTIRDLQALSGPGELRPAAVQAVRQWIYKPYLLNGRPTEVETTITVNFKIF